MYSMYMWGLSPPPPPPNFDLCLLAESYKPDGEMCSIIIILYASIPLWHCCIIAAVIPYHICHLYLTCVELTVFNELRIYL
jgi:hypothetical protein